MKVLVAIVLLLAHAGPVVAQCGQTISIASIEQMRKENADILRSLLQHSGTLGEESKSAIQRGAQREEIDQAQLKQEKLLFLIAVTVSPLAHILEAAHSIATIRERMLDSRDIGVVDQQLVSWLGRLKGQAAASNRALRRFDPESSRSSINGDIARFRRLTYDIVKDLEHCEAPSSLK